MDVYRKIETGKFSDIELSELKQFLLYITSNNFDYSYISSIMYKIINNVRWDILYSAIVGIKELDVYLMYLFHKNIIPLKYFNFSKIKYLINNTTWGLDFFLKNIDEIANSNMIEIVAFCIEDDDYFKPVLNSFKNKDNKLSFVEKCLLYNCTRLLEDNDIVDVMYEDGIYEQMNLFDNNKNKVKLNNIGQHLYGKRFEDFVSKYGDDLFKSEESRKLMFLYCNSDILNNYYDTYKIALDIYEKGGHDSKIDGAISYLINYGNYDDFCKKIYEYSPNGTIKTLTPGSTSIVFDVGSHVLKFSFGRYQNDLNINFFRIVPHQIIYLRDDKGEIRGVIEWQKKINTSPELITSKMIYELFMDFKRAGLYLADPKCLTFDPCNFGMLDSYKDAFCNDPEKLPDNFKKNPLVLLDVDLIYKNGEKPPFNIISSYTMDDAINDYEKVNVKKRT